MTVKAIYQDRAEPPNRFTGIVIRTAEGWRIQTDSGTRAIDFYIQEPSASGGLCEFVDYEVCPEQRLRPADIIPFINSVRATLPVPQKPSEPPQVADPKIHLEPKLPGEGSLQQLQRAAAKVEAQARGDRERQRRKIVLENQYNSTVAQRAWAARQEKTGIAQAMKKRLEK